MDRKLANAEFTSLSLALQDVASSSLANQPNQNDKKAMPAIPISIIEEKEEEEEESSITNQGEVLLFIVILSLNKHKCIIFTALLVTNKLDFWATLAYFRSIPRRTDDQ